MLLISHVLQMYGPLYNPTMSMMTAELSMQSFVQVYSFFSDALFVFLIQIRSSDTSTAESGSEVEEMASPKTTRSYLQPKLTPVCEEVSVFI